MCKDKYYFIWLKLCELKMELIVNELYALRMEIN